MSTCGSNDQNDGSSLLITNTCEPNCLLRMSKCRSFNATILNHLYSLGGTKILVCLLLPPSAATCQTYHALLTQTIIAPPIMNSTCLHNFKQSKDLKSRVLEQSVAQRHTHKVLKINEVPTRPQSYMFSIKCIYL